MNIIKKLKLMHETDKLRIKENQNEVNQYNKTMTVGMLHSAILVLLLPLLASPFLEHFVSRFAICLSSMGVLFVILILSKKGFFNRQPLIGLYLTVSTGSFLTMLLSVISSPDQRATIFLGTFCIIPIVYIDYFGRKLCYSLSMLILHSALALYFKSPMLAFADTLNSMCLLGIGSFIGYLMQRTKLTSFELKRNLVYERETDILTGLKNRRKMIELLDSVKENRVPNPCCAVLLDIDHFKQYNDLYGHTVGDELLRALGELLLDFETKYNMKFYRYGGEEFTAFMWDYSTQEQAELLEKIRVSVEEMEVEHKRTISVGYIGGLEECAWSLENALTLADTALYEAKNRGRNRVVCYDASLVKE